MTIKLEISGDTLESFMRDGLNALTVLARGVQVLPAPLTPPPASEGPQKQADEPKPAEAKEEKKSRGRPKAEKAPEPKPEEKPAEASSADALLDMTATAAAEKQGGEKFLTVKDDLFPRMVEIKNAHTKRGNDQAACVAYIKQLIGEFDVAKVSDIPPEKFGEWMKRSEAYLDGSAKLEAA